MGDYIMLCKIGKLYFECITLNILAYAAEDLAECLNHCYFVALRATLYSRHSYGVATTSEACSKFNFELRSRTDHMTVRLPREYAGANTYKLTSGLPLSPRCPHEPLSSGPWPRTRTLEMKQGNAPGRYALQERRDVVRCYTDTPHFWSRAWQRFPRLCLRRRALWSRICP